MKILTFTSLYPNAEFPTNGIFVETRLRQLRAHYPEVESLVVAPVPWFPSTHARFGQYARMAKVPEDEERGGVRILHPRYPLIPKIGMSLAPYLMAWGLAPVLRRLIKGDFNFDLIDAHYYYPDGVAAAMLGRKFGKPVVITGRGTDIHSIPAHRIPRALLLNAARDAAASITVAAALKTEMVRLGAQADKIHVLRNGVDLEFFCPQERESIRSRLGMSGKTLISVGNLTELKGHHLIIEAMAALSDYRLLVIGSGGYEHTLRAAVQAHAVGDRVKLIPRVSQQALREYYAGADALILASSREGWANVLLESMACGTPVIATRIWGTPEVVTEPEAGVLIPQRDAAAIVAGVRALFERYPDRTATRRYAERFNWRETSDGQMALFRAILQPPRRALVG